MPTTTRHGRPARTSDRPLWWLCLGLFTVAGLAWLVATPLFTGPDEVSQARRAAAVARGELVGRRTAPGPPLLLEVDVPELYGHPADDQWRCFLGPLVPGTPQTDMALPPATCPDLHGGSRLVRAGTVQYRGQPFFYGLAGLPTLALPGVAGAYGMRLVGLLLAAAFLASAAVSTRRAPFPALAGLGLLACATPAVLYLAASTNPSAVEIAAAISAWATGSLVLRATEGPDRRTLTRFGVALVVLVLGRGLGPLFAAAVLVVLGATAGRARCRALLRRNDVRAWAGALVAAGGVTLAWLAHIGGSYALPDRPGSGLWRAAGWLPWYLRQSVGVFGTNDSAVSPGVAGVWCLVAVAVLAVGATRVPRRVAALGVGTVVAGLALNVTAEGLSLPPIGFFWQGRYALPLLLGGLVLVTMAAGHPTPGDEVREAPLDVLTPGDFGADRDDNSGLAFHRAMALAAAVLVAVQGVAFVVVARHHGAQGGATQPVLDALVDPRWSPPLPPAVLLLVYVAAHLALAVVLTGSGDLGRQARSRRAA